ncbi:MAG: hypothetical protein U0270_05530 [Labilithrix sp.]
MLLATSDASAIEQQHHLGLAPAFGMLNIKDKSTVSAGFGGALHYAYGLTDQWNLTLDASSVVVAADQKLDPPANLQTRPAAVHQAGAGVSYVIDILRVIPWFGIEGGACLLTGGTLDRAIVVPDLSVGVGLDYQLSRTFAVGVTGREHLMISKLDTYPSYLTAMLRFEVMWGY